MDLLNWRQWWNFSDTFRKYRTLCGSSGFSYLFVCLTYKAYNACEYVRVGWLRKQQTGCIHVNQNQHASTTANTTFLFCFHYSLFFSSFLGVFFSFFLISTIIMLDYSLPALRPTIAKLLIKFSNINPIVVSVSHRYSLLFLKKIKWETNRNIKRAI